MKNVLNKALDWVDSPGISGGRMVIAADKWRNLTPGKSSPENRLSYEIKQGTIASWANPYLKFGLPLVMLIDELATKKVSIGDEYYEKIVYQIELFQNNLLSAGLPIGDIKNASYLLCTYLDRKNIELTRRNDPNQFPKSFLVRFHGDAWGGKDCFSDLNDLLENPGGRVDLLALYDFILSLGLDGKYKMMLNGQILLEDLRTRLHDYLYKNNQSQDLVLRGDGVTVYHDTSKLNLWLIGLFVLVLIYLAGLFSLHFQASKIKESLLSWNPLPPVDGIMESLPPPLPQLIKEGWLEARKYSGGWLLILKTDGAFEIGKASLTPSYIANIKRLALALAPWPGELSLIGHTDNLPIHDSQYPNNQALSEARAKVVKAQMKQVFDVYATGTKEVEALGRGDADPMADNLTEVNRRKNRRVDIFWKLGNRSGNVNQGNGN